jgi:hypothetical protein
VTDPRLPMRLPGPQLTVPSEPEEAVPVRRSDWARIRRCVWRLKNPVPYLGQVAWTFVGIAVSSGVGYLAWRGTEAQLTRAQKYDNRWVTPTLLVICGAALVIAGLAFITARQVKRQNTVSVDQVLEDMDAVYPPSSSRAVQRSGLRTTGTVRLRPRSPE